MRSAAFCLGALQALHDAKVLSRVDYLSTVSGGGYIGCSLSAALEIAGKRADEAATDKNSNKDGKPEKKGFDRLFPFAVNDVEDETPSMQHLRDDSNYLFPSGASDFIQNAAICLRGLIANAIVILPFLLIAAALTTYSYKQALMASGAIRFPFTVTTCLAAILVATMAGWAFLRSMNSFQNKIDAPSLRTKEMAWFALAVLAFAFTRTAAHTDSRDPKRRMA